MADTDTITLTRTEYEDLVDARDHALAIRDIAGGAAETLTSAGGGVSSGFLAAAQGIHSGGARDAGRHQAVLVGSGRNRPALVESRDLRKVGQGVERQDRRSAGERLTRAASPVTASCGASACQRPMAEQQ